MTFALSDIQLTSTAFEANAPIPRKHTGDSDDVSPPLAWRDAPEGTRGYAVICHDPDAPLVTPAGGYGFVHWVLYNIPATVTRLEEGSAEFTAGQHDGGGSGYMGPKPPEGHGLHQYYFWVLALDQETDFEPGLKLPELLARVEPHVLGMNRLVGTCERG